MAFATLVAAVDMADCTPATDCPPLEVAGLYTSFLISPRFLASDGRSSWYETGPTASDEPRWDVAVSGEEAWSSDSRLAPFMLAELSVRAVPSAGRKRTLIFFSWMDDFDVCSICDHCTRVSLQLPDSGCGSVLVTQRL